MAVLGNNVAAAKALIENGAAMNVRGILGKAPLTIAVQEGRTDLVATLLAWRAEVNTADDDGRSPLTYAAEKNYLEIARLLTARKADINAKSHEGWTPLMFAVNNNHADMTGFLIRSDADLEIANLEGWTALMFAARNGNADLAQLLLRDHNGGVNATNKKGQTPLFLAIENDRTSTIDVLIKSGAEKLSAPLPRGTVK